MRKRLRVSRGDSVLHPLSFPKGIRREVGNKSTLMTQNLPLYSWRQYGYYMHSLKELKEAVEKGYLYFWTRPDKPWRNKIYEANIFASEVKNLNKSEIGKGVSRQEKDIPKQDGGLRNMWMQSSNGFRPTPQSGSAWK